MSETREIAPKNDHQGHHTHAHTCACTYTHTNTHTVSTPSRWSHGKCRFQAHSWHCTRQQKTSVEADTARQSHVDSGLSLTLALLRLSKHRWSSGREAVECLQRVMTWRDTWPGHLAPPPSQTEKTSAEQGCSENSHVSQRTGWGTEGVAETMKAPLKQLPQDISASHLRKRLREDER